MVGPELSGPEGFRGEGVAMHLALSQEVVAAVVTVGLTVVAGAIGYLIREHVTRAKPFVAVLEISGGTRASGSRVDVPQDLVESLRRCTIFPDLEPSSRLSDITDAWRTLARFARNGPNLLALCSTLIRALNRGDGDEVQSALYGIFNNPFSDEMVSNLVAYGEVTVPPADQALPVVLPFTFEANYDGGCYFLAIAGTTAGVSSNLSKMTVLGRQRFDAFFELIKRLELPKLVHIFSQVEAIAQKLHPVAVVASPKLEEILDQNSQWSFKIFAANLGTTPFLVAPQITLFVQDTTKAEYSEHCELGLVEHDQEGEEVRRPSAAPLILRAQSDVTFVVVTATVQEKMERGAELRQVFKSGKAWCEIRFTADQVGFRRRITFNSPRVQFRSEG